MGESAAHSRKSAATQWIVSFAMILATIIITIVVLRAARRMLNAPPPPGMHAVAPPFTPGVLAKITSGGVTVEREFKTLDFSLQLGQPMDDRLPAGPLEAEFAVHFMPRQATHAKVGAVLRNGSVIIMRNGEVLHSNFVGDVEQTVLTTVPVNLVRAPQELTYIFKTDGKSPVTLRAVWQPIDADQPQPLPMPAK